MSNGDNIVEIKEERMNAKGTAPLIGILKHNKNNNEKGGRKKVIAIVGFLLRLGAIAASLGAATTMGTSGQTLSFFTQFFQFEASYDDLPTFQFFVIAMAIVAAYLVLSLPFSIVSIIRPHVVGPKLLLIILDTVVLTLATSASAAGAAVVYLAHNGNSNANWLAICQNYGDFCQEVSGAVVSSFIAVVMLLLLILLSACSL